MAATGEVRDPRSAGRRAAPTVASVPTTSDTTTVRASSTGGVDGKSMPTDDSSRRMPRARTTPTPRPTAEAASPTAADSPMTAVTSWRRVAPRHRRRASSLARWASRMEKVLKIKKMATNSATPAKTSSTSPKTANPLSMLEVAEAIAWRWVWTRKPGPRAAATRPARTSGVTPGPADATTSSTRPGVPSTAWVSPRVRPTIVAPARVSASP